MLLSGDALRPRECDSVLRMYQYKCYLSGDALHGSGTQINPIKRHLCCVTSLSETPEFVTHDSKLFKIYHALKIIKLQDVQMLILCTRLHQNAPESISGGVHTKQLLDTLSRNLDTLSSNPA